MKSLRVSLGAFTLFFSCLSSGQATESVRISVQYIAVPFETLQSHLETHSRSKLHEEIFALRKKGKAKVLETIVATSKSGGKSESESHEGSIFPTEYNPPELQIAGGGGFNPYREKDHTTRSKLWITAWETRYIGSILEQETTIIEKDIVALRLVSELSTTLRKHKHYSVKDQWGEADIMFPIFNTLRTKQPLRLRDGVFNLITVHEPKDPKLSPFDNTRILVFIRADVISP